jgi:glycosyltransferase involved in cell wall biosynthesis
MARILWIGDAGCTTGFGRVSHAIGDRLVTVYGHDIHALAINYEGDYWPTPMKLYRPNRKVQMDIYGQSRFVELLGELLPDLVFMLNDPYVVMKFLLRNRWDEELILARLRPIIAYLPVDGVNWPESWRQLPDFISSLPSYRDGAGPWLRPVTMTKFGQSVMPSDVIYHGVDAGKFWPVSRKDPMVSSTGKVITSKTEAKALFGYDSQDFVVLRVDRNSARKNYADTWRALVPVMKRHKNVKAWFHCKVEGDSLEIPQLINREPQIKDRFRFPADFSTKAGWSDADLAILYNAADVFISTSWGEGFGLTLAEAAMSGVPVIAQNVSSIPEVVGPGGILLEPQRHITVDSGQDQWLPDVEAFSDALERLYQSSGARRTLGDAGHAHVSSSFSWDEAARRFDELITDTLTSPRPHVGEEEHAPYQEPARV